MRETKNLILGFFITCGLAVISLYLDWVSVGFASENGIEQGVSFFVIPFAIIAVLSLALKLEKKIIFIIFGVIVALVAGILCILLLAVKSDMGMFGSALAIGFYLMLGVLFANVVLGIMSVVNGVKKIRLIINIRFAMGLL